MASQEIVSCPGCGKRYTVPPGVPPGQFQCQDCSAVVAYGAAPEPEAARHAGGGASARKHARATAAKRRMERERQEDDDDRGRHGHGAPAQGHNPVFYVLGFVVLACLVGGIAFLHSRNQETARREREAEEARAKEARAAKEAQLAALRAAAAEADAQAQAEAEAKAKKARERAEAAATRRPAPAPAGGGIKAASRDGAVVGAGGSGAVKYAENPPTGGNYGKTQSEILVMLKKNRAAVLTDLPHLPDTPSALQAQVDADVKAISDPNAGGEALQAEDRLVKTGRPAIPRVLGVASHLDFSRFKSMAEARDQCVIASSVDRILREITGYTTPPRLHFTPEGRLDDYPTCIDEWYLWWLTTGYKRETFYKTAPEKETEEKL